MYHIGNFLTAVLSESPPVWGGSIAMYDATSEAWHNVAFQLEEVEVAEGPPAPEPVEPTFTCEPLGLDPSAESAPVLRVLRHDLADFNGDYCYAGDTWGTQPHFESASAMHFYNYQNAYWQFDHREQPDPANGLADYASGGYMVHGGWYWQYSDFTDHQDFYAVQWVDQAGVN